MGEALAGRPADNFVSLPCEDHPANSDDVKDDGGKDEKPYHCRFVPSECALDFATYRRALHIVALLALFTCPAGAETITGRASVIDGDTIRIGRERIRLHGIDAPEARQTCTGAAGPYACGAAATLALARIVAGHLVICDARSRDRYGRSIAVCRAGGQDLGRWLVSQGLAVAYRRYSHDYEAEEANARRNRLGLWAGSFTNPEQWRTDRRRK